MIRFVVTDKPVIGEVYEQMDIMLGQIKDIVESKDPTLYDHIHTHVIKRWEHLNVLLHALAYVLTPKYYSPSWLAKPTPESGVKTKPHTDPEVQVRYCYHIYSRQDTILYFSDSSTFFSQFPYIWDAEISIYDGS